jgi:hypothetical protein
MLASKHSGHLGCSATENLVLDVDYEPLLVFLGV